MHTVSVASDKGRRSENQDYADTVSGLLPKDNRVYTLAGLADGHGKHGAAMSAAAVQAAFDAMNDLFSLCRVRPRHYTTAVEVAFQEANKATLAVKGTTEGTSGTTLDLLLFTDTYFLLGHLGDARVYAAGSGLRQLTKDSVLYKDDSVPNPPPYELGLYYANATTKPNALGYTKRVYPDIIVGQAKRMLLVTDGIWRTVHIDELSEALGQRSALECILRRARNPAKVIEVLSRIHNQRATGKTAEQLYESLAAHDNTTAVLVEYSDAD